MTRGLVSRGGIASLQNDVAEIYKRRGFTDDPVTVALGLCEEAGEVARCVNRLLNPKYVKRKAGSYQESLPDELADVCIYLLALANSTGCDLESVLVARLAEDMNGQNFPAQT